MIHLLMSHPGTHAVAHAAPVAALPLIFRRAIAAVRRKPAAPEVSTSASGAGATGGSDWDDAMPRPHIPDDRSFTESLAWAEIDAGRPVLGDGMLSEVREQWDAPHDDAEPAAPAPWRPSSAMSTGEFRALDVQVDYWRAQPRRPVNGQVRPDRPRQEPVPFGELNRKFSDGRPTPELLRQVLAGLKKLGTEREATYRGGWQ